MTTDDFSPKAPLLSYLDLVTHGKMEMKIFCDNFEHVYNMELNKAELNPSEAKAFARLFEKVAWFSLIGNCFFGVARERAWGLTQCSLEVKDDYT